MASVRTHSAKGALSVLALDSPHSGVDYPPDFQPAVPLPDLRRAEDTHVEDLFNFAPELGIPLVAATFPRSYIDANRAVDEIDPELLDGVWSGPVRDSAKTRLGKGLVWRLLDDGRPIYARKLTPQEVQRRIDTCWHPYHGQVRAMLDATYAAHGQVLHLNCHSMPSVSDRLTTDRPGLVHPDIVLGDRDGTSADPRITAWLRQAFESRGYSCWVNDPYKGVELVRAYSDPARGRHAIQLEINRRLYMDETTLVPHAGFARLREDLRGVLTALSAFVAARA
ncbi:MAG: N-formylglutamate amidohydrolase [Rhodoferax sp.]